MAVGAVYLALVSPDEVPDLGESTGKRILLPPTLLLVPVALFCLYAIAASYGAAAALAIAAAPITAEPFICFQF